MRFTIFTSLLLAALVLFTARVAAQGFAASPINWPIPSGGFEHNGDFSGFCSYDGFSFGWFDDGSQNWTIMDMDGDSLPDMVVTGEVDNGEVYCYAPGANQYWKVYFNTGSGFSTTAFDWPLPPYGGLRDNGDFFGFPSMSATASISNDFYSQSWQVMDINGDLLPDMVVTAENRIGANGIAAYYSGSGFYWNVFLNTGTGFSSIATTWDLPVGGKTDNNFAFGFNGIGENALTTYDAGSQSWRVSDIDGDRKPDLIVIAELQAGNVTTFSPTSNQYWKVFLNQDTAFSMTSIDWGLPNGGRAVGGITYGFDGIENIAQASHDAGSQTWEMIDMNNDAKPDMLVTGELQGGNVTSFSPGSNQYWKVYYNTGNNFSAAASNWMLPSGGSKVGGVNKGFFFINNFAYTTDDIGSQSWWLTDLDGDHLLDLVLIAEQQSGSVTTYSPSANQYWKYYLQAGNGFASTANNWSLPSGGMQDSNLVFGLMSPNYMGHGVGGNNIDGSQLWATRDIDGDQRPDLVVTGEKQGGETTPFSPQSNSYWKVYTNTSTASGLADPVVNSLTLFPNPSHGIVKLATEKPLTNAQLNVMDASGKMVYKSTYPDFTFAEIDLSQFQDGFYIFSISSESAEYRGKLILVRD